MTNANSFTLPEPKIEYISGIETAKLIRQALKKNWPAVKFSVRYKSYSGGSSIDVYWTDGPRAKVVERVTAGFAGGDFDGMIDLKTSHTSWLESDGTAHTAHDRGTAASRGSIPEYISDPATPGARQVRFCTDFVFTSRTVTMRQNLTEHYAGSHDRGYDDQGIYNQPDWHCPECQYIERMQQRREGWIARTKPTIRIHCDGSQTFIAPDGYETKLTEALA